MQPDGRLVYLCYDAVPSQKGACIHIAAFTKVLAQHFGPLELVCVAPPPPKPVTDPGVTLAQAPVATPSVEVADSSGEVLEIWPGVFRRPFRVEGRDFIARVMGFRGQLAAWWDARRPQAVHFRSIFEGYPLAIRKGEVCERIVYEVNGLPSIELKYHYPDVADDQELLRKLKAQEDRCITAADLLVTPSAVTASHLISRGADKERVKVIPNGVALETFTYHPPRPWVGREVRMLYAGTMTSWQGVHLALEALALYRRDYPARLTLVGPARVRQRRDLLERAQSLKVGEFVELLDPVPQSELARLHHESDVVVAPLMPNDRNLVQGCCPLKVLEAMASGTPVITSRMPVVTDLLEEDVHALLVKAGSAKQIKDAMLRLREDPELVARLSTTARKHVEERFTWEAAGADLIEAYHEHVWLDGGSTPEPA